MSITPGTLCIVISTVHTDLLGRICTCISNTPQYPQFGSHLFRMQDGDEYYGEPRNVRPITPPTQDERTQRPERETA